MLNQLRQIVIFAKTVEHGSFRKAAKALHLSPSVVSHHIAKLEEQLGVALLYRSTRKISLTSDGETLLVSAHAMIEAAEDFLNVATKQSAQLMGELSVALPAVLQRTDFVNHIGAFAQLHPNVNIRLDFSDLQRDLVKDGIDVAIRMGSLEDSSLKARKFCEVERCVVTSAEYAKSKTDKENITIDEIETWDWIELTPVGLNNIYSFTSALKRNFRPKSNISVNSAYAIHQLISSGYGIGALPTFLVKEGIANGTLIQVMPEIKIKNIGVYAIWPSNAPKSGLTSQFVSFLKRALKNQL